MAGVWEVWAASCKSHHRSIAVFHLVGFRKSCLHWQRGCPSSLGGQCLFAWGKMSLIICPPWLLDFKAEQEEILRWETALVSGGLCMEVCCGGPRPRRGSGDSTGAET